ncbi:MAG: DNA -binding domain-containing protein [Allosphingosinicella sp.]|uniref:DNA -binding domain-containing protein n=1 Tax=Allosphingosinicella sp. TaxID=2823234 RepID=UPI00395349CB
MACARTPTRPDWRDAASYEILLDADRAAFAWEWLRRDPLYAGAASGALPDKATAAAAAWGLHAFENPSVAVPVARPFWTRDAHSLVLDACAELRSEDSQASGSGTAAGPAWSRSDLFDLQRIRPQAMLLPGRTATHLLLSDGLRSIRLDVAGAALDQPVRLHYRFAGLASVEAPLLVLRRLVSFWRSGRMSLALHPRETKARRWIALLRTADAREAGVSQREIAAALLSGDAALAGWRLETPSLRSRVQRLVRVAQQMGAGGWRRLLRP